MGGDYFRKNESRGITCNQPKEGLIFKPRYRKHQEDFIMAKQSGAGNPQKKGSHAPNQKGSGGNVKMSNEMRDDTKGQVTNGHPYPRGLR